MCMHAKTQHLICMQQFALVQNFARLPAHCPFAVCVLYFFFLDVSY